MRAQLADGQAVNLSAEDPQDLERGLQDGTLSLLDVLLIARAIHGAGYWLSASPTEGADGDLAGARGGATDEQTARAVHDLLLQTVHARTADCPALCAGDPSACGSRRSFGGGVPCAIAGQTQDKISGHFGAGWCVADFCPAMSRAME